MATKRSMPKVKSKPSSRSLKGEPEDARYISGLKTSAQRDFSDGSSIFFVQDDQHRERLRREVEAQTVQAASQQADLLSKIDTVLNEVDPVAIYSHLVAMDSQRRHQLPGSIAFGSDAMMDFLGARVAARPAAETIAALGREYSPQLMLDLDHYLQELASVQSILLMKDAATPHADESRNVRDAVRFLLQMEQQFDRMAGYEQHVHRVARAVLASLASVGRETLGFTPEIILDLIEEWDRFRVVYATEAMNTLDKKALPRPSDHAEREKQAAGPFVWLIYATSLPLLPIPEILADRLQRPIDEVRAAIDSMVTSLGTDGGRDPSLPNRFSRFPIVKVDDERYLWPRPTDQRHGVIAWLEDVSAAFPGLRAGYDKSRQNQAEVLTTETLTKVFGEGRVYPNPTYVDSGRVEIDVLILLPGVAVVVEAKGRRLTQPGRQAKRERVATKIKELIDEPLSQVNRAARGIRNAAETWRDNRGRRIAGIQRNMNVLKVIASLERVDPFSTFLAELAEKGDDSRDADYLSVWAVNIADMMAVAELLPTPHELIAYIAARSNMMKHGVPVVFVEADAVASWCNYRTGTEELAKFKTESQELGLEHTWHLSHQCDEINDYFAAEMLGDPVKRPTAHIPDLVGAALSDLLHKNDPSWYDCVANVCNVRPQEWRSIDRALNESARPPRDIRPAVLRRKRLLRGGWAVGESLVVQVRSKSDPDFPHVSGFRPVLKVTLSSDGRIGTSSWKAD